MSPLFLLLLSPCLSLLIGLDIDSTAYRLSVIDTSRKTDPSETMKDRVEESTCISFAEEGRRFDDSPARTLPSNNTVCGYFPLFRSTDLQSIENGTVAGERWENRLSETMEIRIAGETWTSEELVGALLEHIREKVEGKYKGKEIEYVAVVPRDWTTEQRDSFLRVAKVARMTVLGLIHRTTAVALTYSQSKTDSDMSQLSLIFHLSRDFLEVSFVSFSMRRVSKQKVIPIITVVSSYVTRALSTRVVDRLISRFLVEKFESTHKIALKGDFLAEQKLFQKASEVRKALLTKDQAVITEELKGKVLKYTVKSSEYKDLLKQLKPSLLSSLEQSILSAQLTKSNVTSLIIAGEDSRNTYTQGLLQELFTTRLPVSLHEETAVARGAGLFAANLSAQCTPKAVWMNDANVLERTVGKPLTDGEVVGIAEKLNKTKADDEEKRTATEARIKLQSSLRAFKALLHDKGYLRVTTEQERTGLVSLVSTTDEWLNAGEGRKGGRTVVAEKNEELQRAFSESHDRLQESKSRPEALKAAFTQLSALNATMVNLNVTKEWLPVEERNEVFKELQAVKEKLEGIQKEQVEKNPWETISLKSSAIRSEVSSVAKSVEKVQKSTKPKPPPPTPPPTPPKEATKAESEAKGKPQTMKPKTDGKKGERKGPKTDL